MPTSTIINSYVPGGGDFSEIVNAKLSDILEQTIKAGAANLRAVKIDNSQNQTEEIHVALCNTVGAVVAGSYDPEEMLMCPKRGVVYMTSDPITAYATGLKVFTKKEAGSGGSTQATTLPILDFGLTA